VLLLDEREETGKINGKWFKINWFHRFPVLLVSGLKAVVKIPSFRLKVKKEE